MLEKWKTHSLSQAENIWLFFNAWKSVNIKTEMNVDNQATELRSERSLFARLVVVAKTRPDIDIKLISKFEHTT